MDKKNVLRIESEIESKLKDIPLAFKTLYKKSNDNTLDVSIVESAFYQSPVIVKSFYKPVSRLDVK